MSDTYAKLMSSIVTSSVWVEPHATFRVWIALLALKDKNGEVRAAVPGLANLCRVTVDECAHAIDTFLAPDPYSRTKENEGRRIEPIDGGWRVLNHDYYRRLESQQARAEYKADWMKRARDSKKVNKSTRVDKSGHIQDTNTDAPKEPPLPPEGDGAADAEPGDVPGAPAYTAIFETFWKAYPTTHKGSKAKAFGIWQRKRLAAAAATLIEDVTHRGKEHGEWLRESGRFIPHVTTYLNGRTWECVIEKRARSGLTSRDRSSVEAGNQQAAAAFAGDEE